MYLTDVDADAGGRADPVSTSERRASFLDPNSAQERWLPRPLLNSQLPSLLFLPVQMWGSWNAPDSAAHAARGCIDWLAVTYGVPGPVLGTSPPVLRG